MKVRIRRTLNVSGSKLCLYVLPIYTYRAIYSSFVRSFDICVPLNGAGAGADVKWMYSFVYEAHSSSYKWNKLQMQIVNVCRNQLFAIVIYNSNASCVHLHPKHSANAFDAHSLVSSRSFACSLSIPALPMSIVCVRSFFLIHVTSVIKFRIANPYTMHRELSCVTMK